jgi:hypothetical protein
MSDERKLSSKTHVDRPVGVTDQEIETTLRNQIQLLHDYNELKDIGQMLLGKLAELQGTTSASLYEDFGLSLSD